MQRVDGRERLRIVAVVGEARGRVMIIRQHLAFIAEALRDRIVDGARGVERGLLRDEGDAGARRRPALTVVEVGLPGENLEQR